VQQSRLHAGILLDSAQQAMHEHSSGAGEKTDGYRIGCSGFAHPPPPPWRLGQSRAMWPGWPHSYCSQEVER
jgi:hypothetical protein